MGAAAAIYFPDSLIDRNLGTGIRMVLLRTAGERGDSASLGCPPGYPDSETPVIVWCLLPAGPGELVPHPARNPAVSRAKMAMVLENIFLIIIEDSCSWQRGWKINKRSHTPSRPTFLNHSGQSAQHFIDLFRIPKHRRHIGLEHHDDASCGVPRCVPVGLGAAEVVFREYLVGAG